MSIFKSSHTKLTDMLIRFQYPSSKNNFQKNKRIFKGLSLMMISFLFIVFVNGQGNQWTWMSGGPLYGIYGSRGIPSVNNKPGSRQNAFFWQDPAGMFWLFGGTGYAQSTSSYLNDLWKFNPQTQEWTWVSGDSTASVLDNWGSLGIPSSTNKPGGRGSGAGWSDPAGNIWIFGGEGIQPGVGGDLNDLWKYDPVTDIWTWMRGKKTFGDEGTYVTIGVPSPFNDPKSRALCNGWSDDVGNLYLFGGISTYNGTTPSTLMNDLWKYSTSTNQWTWLKGMKNYQPGVYGLRGIPATDNTPGSRAGASVCKGANGSFWLICGVGMDAQSQTGVLNDLWKYDALTSEWIWISGDTIFNQISNFGSMGISSSANKPGSRYLSALWADINGNIWLYGGQGRLVNHPSELPNLSDLWQYKSATDQWTWIKGDTSSLVSPVYGTLGIPALNNTPGNLLVSYYWSDAANNLWLKGNDPSTGESNDLWKYSPLTTVPISLISFNGFYDQDQINLYWQMEDETNVNVYEIERSFDGSNYQKIGVVRSTGIKQYQFNDESKETIGKTNFYRLKMADDNGKYVYSKVIIINLANEGNLIVSPNPASTQLYISCNKIMSGQAEIKIADFNGRTLQREVYNIQNNSIILSVANLPSANYILYLFNNGKKYTTIITVKK